MMRQRFRFRTILTSLWFRLTSIGIVAVVFAEALHLAPEKVQYWSYYLGPTEVIYEVAVRLIFAGLVGIALGSICTAVIAPGFWYSGLSPNRIFDWATKSAVMVVVFLDSSYGVVTLVNWSHHWTRFIPLLLVVYFVGFAIAVLIPSLRREILSSLDDFVGEKSSRHTVIGILLGAAALILLEFALSNPAPDVKASQVSERPKKNFLLITFDALSAEDMSLYGRKLPTTPNIDRFAQKATVFTNFYSGSTFTTPSIATMMTGMYPSESHVYQLQGRVDANSANGSLPRLMQEAGYATGAFISNPFAYYLARSMENGFDVLPEPAFQPGRLERLWEVTRPLHQDSGVGSRIDEYFALERVWNSLSGTPGNLSMRYRPAASFEEARRALANMPDGFFFWLHLITPHEPYLPDAEERGRFLPQEKSRTCELQCTERWKPRYEADQQNLVDQCRLCYDEFIATADRTFGRFMSRLEKDGKLRNTTVIVSADHGESFEGGVYQHESPDLTRPVIHIPLIIRAPDQQQGSKVDIAADQTALAPTILELAGLRKSQEMSGPSLVGWLKGKAEAEGHGLAFSQYLEKNSTFKPLRKGKVGVIDGHYEYVLNITTGTGALRPLSEAQFSNVDRSTENPSRAEALRGAIYSRFPDLLQKWTSAEVDNSKQALSAADTRDPIKNLKR